MDNKITIGELARRIESTDAVMLYFFSNNCAPCLQLRPKVEDMISAKFPDMDLIMIDAEQQSELNASYSAFSFPVLIVFFGGKEFYRYNKYVSVNEIEKEIGRIYKIYFS